MIQVQCWLDIVNSRYSEHQKIVYGVKNICTRYHMGWGQHLLLYWHTRNAYSTRKSSSKVTLWTLNANVCSQIPSKSKNILMFSYQSFVMISWIQIQSFLSFWYSAQPRSCEGAVQQLVHYLQTGLYFEKLLRILSTGYKSTHNTKF